MTIQEKVVFVLQRVRPPLCDGCIRKLAELKYVSDVNQIVLCLGRKLGITRKRGVCNWCQNDRLVNRLD